MRDLVSRIVWRDGACLVAVPRSRLADHYCGLRATGRSQALTEVIINITSRALGFAIHLGHDFFDDSVSPSYSNRVANVV